MSFILIVQNIFLPKSILSIISGLHCNRQIVYKMYLLVTVPFSVFRRMKIQKTVRRRKNEMRRTERETKIRTKRRKNE